MWLALLLSGALAAGQAPASGTDDTTPAPPAPTGAPRYAVMKHLQGTYYGSLLDDHKLRLYGWTEASFTASTAPHDQLPIGFNYVANDFLLQQHYLRLERPTDPSVTTPTFGFRIDNILGADARFTIARGLLDGLINPADGTVPLYGYDPVQFYAEAFVPQVCRGLTIKFGRFFCQFGAESIDTTQNALTSHSYSFIFDPFTHTGLLTQVQLDDAWSIQNGLVLGSDVFIDPADTPTYIGSVKWAPPKGRASVLFAVILSDPHFDVPEAFNRPQVFDLVYTYKFDDRLVYTLDALYAYQLGVPDIGFANWYALVQYLTWQASPTLAGNVRLEVFDDVQGQRTGFAGLYTALTTGLTWKPCPDLVVRGEVRQDYNERSRPFEGKKGVITAALDLVLRW